MKRRRVKYHLTNTDILKNEMNYEAVVRIRLAVIDDIIATLRREKIELRRELSDPLKKPYQS